jgi:uncharacterized protein DUF4154
MGVEEPDIFAAKPAARRVGRGRWPCAALLAAWLAIVICARGDEPTREYQLKAVFIFNFAQFTAWPDKAFADGNAPFVVAVIGPDPFGDALPAVLDGKKIADRPIVLKHYGLADEVHGCQLLFVPASEENHLAEIFKAVGDQPVLSVGETDDFPAAGGTIRFLIENNKIRFEVNLDAAKKAGLKISSKLLSLAKIYQP